jgi:hypothetical protein
MVRDLALQLQGVRDEEELFCALLQVGPAAGGLPGPGKASRGPGQQECAYYRGAGRVRAGSGRQAGTGEGEGEGGGRRAAPGR